VLTVATVGAGGQADTTRPSFQAIYALAADQTAAPGKIAAIRATIEAVDGWFATQTTGGVVPRWVRGRDGSATVLTIRLAQTVAQYNAYEDNYDFVVYDITALGQPAKGQKIAVFIDLSNEGACGASSGDVTVLFEAACDIHPSEVTSWPYDATYLLAHELTHNFGAADLCGPHADSSGHVLDDPRDLLYNGSKPLDWDHLMLDVGHDDYYATSSVSCPGITDSPYWTATSDPRS